MALAPSLSSDAREKEVLMLVGVEGGREGEGTYAGSGAEGGAGEGADAGADEGAEKGVVKVVAGEGAESETSEVPDTWAEGWPGCGPRRVRRRQRHAG